MVLVAKKWRQRPFQFAMQVLESLKTAPGASVLDQLSRLRVTNGVLQLIAFAGQGRLREIDSAVNTHWLRDLAFGLAHAQMRGQAQVAQFPKISGLLVIWPHAAC